jgi:hypothetical protein
VLCVGKGGSHRHGCIYSSSSSSFAAAADSSRATVAAPFFAWLYNNGHNGFLMRKQDEMIGEFKQRRRTINLLEGWWMDKTNDG